MPRRAPPSRPHRAGASRPLTSATAWASAMSPTGQTSGRPRTMSSRSLAVHGPTPGTRDERSLDGVVIECRQPVEIERSVDDRHRQRPPVTGLLAAEPDRQERGVVEPEEARRRERVRRGGEPIEGGLGRGQRDLLLEDDVDDGREARCARPQRGWAVAGHDPGQVRVPRGELVDGSRERRLGQRFDPGPGSVHRRRVSPGDARPRPRTRTGRTGTRSSAGSGGPRGGPGSCRRCR